MSLGVGLSAFRAGDAHWQTLLFTTLIFSSLALAVGMRAEKEPFWKRLLSNPALLGALVLTVAKVAQGRAMRTDWQAAITTAFNR